MKLDEVEDEKLDATPSHEEQKLVASTETPSFPGISPSEVTSIPSR